MPKMLAASRFVGKKHTGAIVDHADSMGQSALHLAVVDGHTECVSLLLRAGVAVNLISDYGAALHLAATLVLALPAARR